MGKPFGFMSPGMVSPIRPENALKTRLQRTQAIADRLGKAGSSQLICIPYNLGYYIHRLLRVLLNLVLIIMILIS